MRDGPHTVRRRTETGTERRGGRRGFWRHGWRNRWGGRWCPCGGIGRGRERRQAVL